MVNGQRDGAGGLEQTSSSIPLTPPRTKEDWLDWLRLLRSRRVGPGTFYRLMAEHGSAAAALDALPALARRAGTTGYAPCPRDVVAAEWDRAERAGAVPVAMGSAAYPARLAEIADPPPILWTHGDLALLARPLVALVGARNASSLGLRMARSLARGLGEAGIVTVSGLARGIDTAVHEASLESGTVAVMAGGVDIVYPAENADLARRIAEGGLRLGEQPVGLRPQARHFPRRNRIISGLAAAVVVVEAAAKSGSLITARDAADQGRDVLAVPGHPFDPRAAGANMLIRDGATLVRGPGDVLESLAIAAPAPRPKAPDAARAGAPPPPPPHAPARDPGPLDRLILDRLGPAPTAEDQLIRDVGRPAGEVAQALTLLEIDGRVARQPGGLLCRLGG